MSSLLSLTLLGFMFITITFIFNSAHFLVSLLCLEGMMLSLVVFITHVTSSMHIPGGAMAIIMLTFGACEASLGLSILVKMSRQYGSDMLSNLAMNKC